MADGKAVISWARNVSDWHLCSSTDLLPNQSRIVAEPPLAVGGDNVVTLPVAGDRAFYLLQKQGAILPFVTLEAEAPENVTTGSTVKMLQAPANATITPEIEASCRGFVELNQTGQYLDFPGVPAANTIVLRHCIPDAPTGGGITATLSLYVNGVFRQKLTLTSKFNWLYGAVGTNGQSNDPAAGPPHVFWDETRAFITGGLAQGDTLRLVKDGEDTAAFYRIDLVDLENVAPALTPPAKGTYLSITDYGANGADTNDDTTAIQNCLNAAKTQSKIVWMPPGTYYQSAAFFLDGQVVQGAGMWYTNLIGTSEGSRWGNVGFVLIGSGSAISDMSVESSVHTTRSMSGGKPISGNLNNTSNWSVSRVWLTHTLVGFWMSGANGGVVRGCRVRMTYADGINLNRGSSNNLIEQNHVRGCGDDGIAVSSETGNTPAPSNNNIVRSNTVIANWSGHNCDIAGGTGHLVEDNYLADNATSGCLTINLPSSFPMYPMLGALFRRNTIVRGGGWVNTQKRGAIWIYAGNQTIDGIIVRDNEIKDSVFFGIHIYGSTPQHVSFEHNVIDNPGEKGVLISSTAVGAGTFTDNICRNKKSGVVDFVNLSSNYTPTLNGNSWP